MARRRAHRSMLCCPMLRTFGRQVGCFEHIVLFTVTNTDGPREGRLRPTVSQPQPCRCANSKVLGDTTSNATPMKVYLSAGTNHFRVVVSPEIKTGTGLNAQRSGHAALRLRGETKLPVRLGLKANTWPDNTANSKTNQARRTNTAEIGRASCRERV